QRAPEQPRRHQRGPDGVLVARRVVALERVHLVPDRLREADLGEDVRGQRAQLLASDQVLEGGRLERLQDALRAGGLEEGTLADAARRPRGNLLEPAQIDDLTARRYEPTIRRKQVPCQDRSGQGEVHHALEGPGGGGGPASGRKRNL